MKIHPSNGWFHHSELPRVADVLHRVASKEHTRWLERSECKYIQIRMDMRTGDFIMYDRNNVVMSEERVLEMFPELAK